jgi:hypothetical protein
MFNSDKTKKCGYTGKPCTGHDCMFFQQFRGQNPQTGQEEDKWECVQVMLPVLLLENSRQTRSIAAATESTRNVMQEALEKRDELKRLEG